VNFASAAGRVRSWHEADIQSKSSAFSLRKSRNSWVRGFRTPWLPQRCKSGEGAKEQGLRGVKLSGIPRRSFLALAAAASSSQASFAADRNDIFHVAIFRFAKQNVEDAIAALRALRTATRQESGNLSYDLYRGIDDDQEFYIVEHWASRQALARTSGLRHLLDSAMAY
jgi:quinol monooxygenase YgiN